MMKICKRKLDIALAEQCKNASDLHAEGIPPATLAHIRKGKSTTTKTLGKIAKALNVPVERLLKQEDIAQ